MTATVYFFLCARHCAKWFSSIMAFDTKSCEAVSEEKTKAQRC